MRKTPKQQLIEYYVSKQFVFVPKFCSLCGNKVWLEFMYKIYDDKRNVKMTICSCHGKNKEEIYNLVFGNVPLPREIIENNLKRNIIKTKKRISFLEQGLKNIIKELSTASEKIGPMADSTIIPVVLAAENIVKGIDQ